MKLTKAIALSLAALVAAGAIAGCGDQKKEAKAPADKKEITVGITSGYSEQVMEFVAKEAERDGLKVNLKSFGDYVTPDAALAAGEIDLTSYQHGPYLEAYNEKNGTKLISIGNTYLAPLRIYSNKYKDLKDVPDGARVSIPNDPSNGGRALALLQSAKLLKLKDGVGVKATVGDIVGNDKKLKIVEIEAALLPRSMDDTDLSVINSNFAMEAKLNPVKDSLFTEPKESPYANIVAVRKGDENRPEIQKLMNALRSPEVKKFIDEKYKGAVVAAF